MDLTPPAEVPPEVSPSPLPAPAEATVRALVTGCLIGAVLAAGNVYTGLKISMIDGGSITAALLGFTLFSTFKRLGRRPYTALENNITQTTAASAAIMGYVAGVGGPVPALALFGRSFPGWALALWGLSIGMIGIFAATLLRRQLIVEEALPFPTGNATGELIETMFAGRLSALRRARFLLVGVLVAAAVTWFRDGKPHLIPATTAFGGVVAGVSLSSLTVAMNWSPLLISTGVMMGIRGAVSMALGATVSWVLLAPWLVHSGMVESASFSACSGWLVWPGLGLLMAGSFLPLLLDWRSVVRALRDLGALAGRRGAAAASDSASGGLAPRVGLPSIAIGIVVIVVIGRGLFGLHPLAALCAIVAALALAVVSARATGETDLAPVGMVGTLTQLIFAGYGPTVSILTGSVSMGVSTQTAQTLWAFKAGQRLGASPRAQVKAQILGSVLGALVVVPVYLVIVKAYGIGTESLPAPSAISWRATAEAVRGGFSAMPRHAPLAGALGLGLGIVLSIAARMRWGRFAPSPAAMGIAMLMPASLSVAALVGALLVLGIRRLRPSLDEASVMSLAAGGIAGESLMGVVIAILMVCGVL
ncbi:MAG TPA: OPT family oligopeptide transporter [Polyangia bacterium]|nr:OPT family oligopeptide transporter [Polyangia bacterium]